jgi:hypothetical protein
VAMVAAMAALVAAAVVEVGEQKGRGRGS